MDIEKIRNIGLDKLVTQVYDFDSLTTDELLCKFAQKINIIIEHLKYIDDRSYNTDKAMELKLQYLLDEGLSEQVAKEILNKINDGTLETLINKDLLADINNQLKIKANESDLITLETRMDNFTTLANGSTTGDAELIDGRIGANGTVYTNIGTAIRTQLEIINNDLENVIGDTLEYNLVWHDNYYISNTNGQLVESTSWKYTDYVDIKSYDKIIIDTSQNGSTSFNAFYDKDKNFISKLDIGTEIVSIPTNAKYFRISNAKSYTTKVKKYLPKLIEKVSPSYVDNKVNEVNEKLTILFGDIEYKYSWNTGGYINNSDGSLIEYNGWKYTDYINLNGATKLKIKTTQNGSTSFNAFYDKDKNFISNLNVALSAVDIPSNAVYVRLSVNENSDTVIVKDIISSSDSVVSLNKDMEPFVVQASEALGSMFSDKTKPLVFTHFSDVHTAQELWDRIMEYNNHYSNYIKFSIHTGDYCGANRVSYIDLYAGGVPCNIPVFNVVGNHDTYLSDNTKGDKKTTHDLLFNHTNNWDVHFMDIENPMTYYKDFVKEKIRLIVLDYYYDIDSQCTWLLERLNEAKTSGYHVITCMHEMTNVIINKLDTTFQTIDKFELLGGNKYSISKFDKVIGDWIKQGGVHVANFAGHEHSDFIGYTENGVLNVCVQTATDNIIWTDGKRVRGTRTWDCFNVVAVETSTATLKLIRIGNNADHYLREKKVFSYNYIDKRIISK